VLYILSCPVLSCLLWLSSSPSSPFSHLPTYLPSRSRRTRRIRIRASASVSYVRHAARRRPIRPAGLVGFARRVSCSVHESVGLGSRSVGRRWRRRPVWGKVHGHGWSGEGVGGVRWCLGLGWVCGGRGRSWRIWGTRCGVCVCVCVGGMVGRSVVGCVVLRCVLDSEESAGSERMGMGMEWMVEDGREERRGGGLVDADGQRGSFGHQGKRRRYEGCVLGLLLCTWHATQASHASHAPRPSTTPDHITHITSHQTCE
jgi:hypothetical protein